MANILTEYYGEERVKAYVIFDCATELQVLRIIENNLGLILYPEYATKSSIFLGKIINQNSYEMYNHFVQFIWVMIPILQMNWTSTSKEEWKTWPLGLD